MENQPVNNRRSVAKYAPKPYMILTRWGAFGWLLSFCVLSGCMFIIGVIIGRNTAPVFDTDLMDAQMHKLKNSSLEQIQKIEKGIEAAQKKKEECLEVARNLDILDTLKEKGKNLLVAKQETPTPKNAEAKPAETAAQTAQPSAQPAETQAATAQPGQPPVNENVTAAPAENQPAQVQPARNQQPQAQPETAQASAESGPKAAGPANEKSMQVAQAEIKPENKKETPQAANPAGKPAPNESQKTNDQQQSKEAASQQQPPQETKESKPAEPGRQYTIQVASLRELDKANIVMEKFKQKGYPAYCQSSPVRGEVWHRVRIGPYSDRTIAETDCSRLKEAGFDALLLMVGQ